MPRSRITSAIAESTCNRNVGQLAVVLQPIESARQNWTGRIATRIAANCPSGGPIGAAGLADDAVWAIAAEGSSAAKSKVAIRMRGI
jgi:hypothetical protein